MLPPGLQAIAGFFTTAAAQAGNALSPTFGRLQLAAKRGLGQRPPQPQQPQPQPQPQPRDFNRCLSAPPASLPGSSAPSGLSLPSIDGTGSEEGTLARHQSWPSSAVAGSARRPAASESLAALMADVPDLRFMLAHAPPRTAPRLSE